MATLSHSDLETLWVLNGGSQETADIAAAIAQAESGGCQYAQRGPRDIRPVKQCVYVHDPVRYVIGLWQINQTAHPNYSRAALFGTTYNAQAAVAISRGGANFQPWTTYTSGAYKRFLTGTVSITPQPGPTYTPTDGVTAPHMHGGWADLRNSMNKHLPRQLAKSDAATRAAYAGLAHRHKRGR